MAFIIAAAIGGSVKAVQSGIQAHKDFNHPEGPQARYDRYGQVKEPGPVYGLVMKAERKFKGKKGEVDVVQGQGQGQGLGEGSSQSVGPLLGYSHSVRRYRTDLRSGGYNVNVC